MAASEGFRERFLVCWLKAGVKTPAESQRIGKADRIFEEFRTFKIGVKMKVGENI